MANTRRPTAFTPFTPAELKEIRKLLKQKPWHQLCSEYQKSHELCQLAGDPPHPPKPARIQELVQLWRELYKREAKGRD
jgi:hypothetical protein